MDKVYLPFYYSWRDITDSLSDQEFGKLVRAVLLYSETGAITEGFTKVAETSYKFMIKTIELSQKRAQSGRLGAYIRWGANQNVPRSDEEQYELERIRQQRIYGPHSEGLVVMTDEQFDDLASRMSNLELNKYLAIIANCEKNGMHFKRKTHYQAILEMAAQDRKIQD